MGNLNIDDVKLILRFEFLDNNKVKLHLVSIKEKYLYNQKKAQGLNYATNINLKYSIYSSDHFLFDNTLLRLPDCKNLKTEISSVCNFNNDEIRKSVLNKLYITLTTWSNKVSNGNEKNCVVIDGEYWYVK